jgi:O-antigen/teichoic acid export membrane protein
VIKISLGRKLLSNSFYLFLDWFIATFMGFLFWLISGKLLLKEDLGIVSTSFNLANILSGISTLGLGAAIWKLIPEYIAKKQEGKIFSLSKFSFKVILTSNIIIIFIFLTFASQISSITNIPKDAVVLTGFMIFMLSMSGYAGMILYGFQNMKTFLLTDWWGILVKVVLSSLLLFLGFKYVGPIMGLIFCFFVISLLRFLKIPISGKDDKINARFIIMHYALPALVGFISSTLFLSGQYILLSSLQNPGETGIYSIAMIIVTPIVVFPGILTSALLPIISGLSANHNTKKQRSRLIELVFRYTLFTSFPAALFLILFSKQVILIFSRPEYLPASQFFPILSISSLIYGLGNLFLSNIYAIGKTKTNRNITILTTTIFFVTAVPLIKMFSSFGLAISYSISVFTMCLTSYIYLRKYIKINLPFMDSFKIVISGVASLFVLYLLSTITQGFIVNIILVCFGSIVYLALLILFGFYKEEDVKLLNMTSEKFPKLKRYVDFIIKIISLNKTI